jgi:hypothetical protein
MVVDVVIEMDDIDMMLARIEMARDKLTKRRIARGGLGGKGPIALLANEFLRKSKFAPDAAAKPELRPSA